MYSKFFCDTYLAENYKKNQAFCNIIVVEIFDSFYNGSCLDFNMTSHNNIRDDTEENGKVVNGIGANGNVVNGIVQNKHM